MSHFVPEFRSDEELALIMTEVQRRRDEGTDTEVYPQGTRVRTTQDWVEHCLWCSEVLRGEKGVEFTVEHYVDARRSDSGFSFYWTKEGPIPAKYVESMIY